MARAAESDVGCVEKNNSSDNLPLTEDMVRRRQNMVMNGMRYPFQNAMLIWSPINIVRPDEVVTILGRHDRDVEVRNRWIRDELQLSQRKVWGGAVAIFNSDRSTSAATTSLAAMDIMHHMKTMTLLPFPRFVDYLIGVESNHPYFGTKFTCVHISGKRSFDAMQQFEVEMELNKFGNVENIIFKDGKLEYGVICEVYYTYVTQAIAAKVIMNDKSFRGIGCISTEVEESALEVDIIKEGEMRIKTFVEYVLSTGT